ncbi:DctP family TRAP transporter solute-binding subunit [Massilia niastensis]|uniref:DctP family TRAP transporter solute-binding subunit n=1 Tax=Massilia niastensis TaxID=544911 RepID=UPI000369FE4A|nr:DctP family TRAP transporter solute-binding subunit [Massilia niastensis]
MLDTLFPCAAVKARPSRRASPGASFPGLARLTLAVLGLFSLAAGPAAAAEPALRQLDIADYRAYLAEDHPVRQGMRRFADLVQAGSGGAVRVRVRTDALPGSPAQQIAALQAGGADAPALMLVAATGLAALNREFELLDLPFLLRDERQADALLDGAFGHALLARMGQCGLVGLAWWENGFRQLTTSGRPIRRAGDLRGLNFRVIGEPVFVEAFRAMGANPIPLPFGQVYEALASKQVEGQDNFYSQILAGRLYEVQSSLSVTRHSYGAMVLVANAEAWGRLTAAQRAVLQAAAVEAGRFQRSLVRDEARQARASLVARGMAVNELEPSERTRLRELTQPMRDRYFGKHKDDLRRLYQAGVGLHEQTTSGASGRETAAGTMYYKTYNWETLK